MSLKVKDAKGVIEVYVGLVATQLQKTGDCQLGGSLNLKLKKSATAACDIFIIYIYIYVCIYIYI